MTDDQSRVLEQITLISRVLEGDVPAPKVIVHDHTINGKPGHEIATLNYSIPIPFGMTYPQRLAAEKLPLYDGTVWKITLQTYKDARAAERQMPGDWTPEADMDPMIIPANVTVPHLRMLTKRPPRDHPDFADYVDALKEYVQALKARDRAATALAKVDRILQERLAALEAIGNRVPGE